MPRSRAKKSAALKPIVPSEPRTRTQAAVFMFLAYNGNTLLEWHINACEVAREELRKAGFPETQYEKFVYVQAHLDNWQGYPLKRYQFANGDIVPSVKERPPRSFLKILVNNPKVDQEALAQLPTWLRMSVWLDEQSGPLAASFADDEEANEAFDAVDAAGLCFEEGATSWRILDDDELSWILIAIDHQFYACETHHQNADIEKDIPISLAEVARYCRAKDPRFQNPNQTRSIEFYRTILEEEGHWKFVEDMIKVPQALGTSRTALQNTTNAQNERTDNGSGCNVPYNIHGASHNAHNYMPAESHVCSMGFPRIDHEIQIGGPLPHHSHDYSNPTPRFDFHATPNAAIAPKPSPAANANRLPNKIILKHYTNNYANHKTRSRMKSHPSKNRIPAPAASHPTTNGRYPSIFSLASTINHQNSSVHPLPRAQIPDSSNTHVKGHPQDIFAQYAQFNYNYQNSTASNNYGSTNNEQHSGPNQLWQQQRQDNRSFAPLLVHSTEFDIQYHQSNYEIPATASSLYAAYDNYNPDPSLNLDITNSTIKERTNHLLNQPRIQQPYNDIPQQIYQPAPL
ncbi:hypothetical protein BJ508DRAFT_381776 [Ascobolus immersus RN42]|uniref:Uncharacterized protein n=1 Tax=Ascobolus immersus RN42 TaxID=1160509 RepID=A0A3N4HCB3_ASCIM|nr:hypothetical protein BJ508DRAFT_381776 [Ascobolus immersus RN42]